MPHIRAPRKQGSRKRIRRFHRPGENTVTNRKYWTLACRDPDTGRWSPQFGDYDKNVVVQERDDYKDAGTYKPKDMVVVSHNDTPGALNIEIERLNTYHKE